LNRYSGKERGRRLIAEKLISDRQKSQPLHPSTVVSCAVEIGVDVKRVANDREKDSIWKVLGENSANSSVAMNYAEQFWLSSGSMYGSQNFVD
jgi:hypothetical protein